MNTEDLIRALAADGSRPVISIERTLMRALLLGAAVSVLWFAVLHPRSDFARVPTFPLIFKLLIVILLAGTAVSFLKETARPFAVSSRSWRLLLAPALLVGGVVLELTRFPAHEWVPRLLGHNAVHCLSSIPLLSLPPVVSLLVALRRGAPRRPAVAGAVAGLVASAVAASLYAIKCPDDSPLFVATWYSIAIAGVTAASAYSGAHILRW